MMDADPVALPFVSVLVPTKNVAPYIGKVLDSLLNLDYPKDRLEIIVLDGYSTDETLELIRKYPVGVRISGSNVPAFSNKTLPDAVGELIAFGDGDAVVDRSWLRSLVRHFTDSGVAGAGGLCLTANPESIVPRVIGYELRMRYERMPETILRIATMNVVYRKSVLLSLGGFDERLDTGYDTEIGHRITRAGFRIRFDPEAVVYHFNRPTLWSFFCQQFTYGKNVAGMYLSHRHLAKGDEVTPLWLNLQPFLYAAIAILLILSVFSPVAPLLGLLLFFFLLLSYLISAVRLALHSRDPSALFFVILCFVRGIAWTLGGAWFAIRATGHRIIPPDKRRIVQ